MKGGRGPGTKNIDPDEDRSGKKATCPGSGSAKNKKEKRKKKGKGRSAVSHRKQGSNGQEEG